MTRSTQSQPPNGSALPPLPLPCDLWNRIAKALNLCPRMKELTELILRNQSDKQIVAATGLGHPTVRSYLSRTFQRAGVGDRHELVLLILRMSHEIADQS